MENKYIKIEYFNDIKPQDFEPYGQIVGLYNEPPLEDLPNLKYYKDNIKLGPFIKDVDEVTLGLLHCKKRKAGEPIVKMEIHPSFTETFIPLHGGEVIFAMAPADDSKEEPDINKLRIFLLDGKLGVSLHRGTWHFPPLPIRDHADMVLIAKGNLSGQSELVDIGYNIFPVF